MSSTSKEPSTDTLSSPTLTDSLIPVPPSTNPVAKAPSTSSSTKPHPPTPAPARARARAQALRSIKFGSALGLTVSAFVGIFITTFLYTSRAFPLSFGTDSISSGVKFLNFQHHQLDLITVSEAEEMSQVGKRIVGYFVNWGIYGRKYFPWDIPYENLTHVNYAFANINGESGTVSLSDTWADVEIHWEGDDWNEPGKNLYGCFKRLFLLKQRNRNLKVMLSIGGWTYSPQFARISDPNWRREFVRSSVKLIEDLGLDGLDIDYEYPKTPVDAHAYVELLAELRAALNNLALGKNRPKEQYQLSVAAPGGAESIAVLKIGEMDRFLDFWNIMSYDFAGSWDNVSGHLAPLFSPDQSNRCVNAAVNSYLNAGVPPNKITVGMPMYGRSFANTDGPGRPFTPDAKGSWEAGNWDYKDLPQAGAQVTEDPRFGLSFSYDPSRRVFISYDTPAVAAHKARYIIDRGLGGAMFWELSGDKRMEDGGESLLGIVKGTFGDLERRPDPVALNEIYYPGSVYDNVRKWSQ